MQMQEANDHNLYDTIQVPDEFLVSALLLAPSVIRLACLSLTYISDREGFRGYRAVCMDEEVVTSREANRRKEAAITPKCLISINIIMQIVKRKPTNAGGQKRDTALQLSYYYSNKVLTSVSYSPTVLYH